MLVVVSGEMRALTRTQLAAEGVGMEGGILALTVNSVAANKERDIQGSARLTAFEVVRSMHRARLVPLNTPTKV